MRALVIEDETKTAAYLRQGLSEHGFNVEVCTNGEDGLHQALTVENDLIILDVMLPACCHSDDGTPDPGNSLKIRHGRIVFIDGGAGASQHGGDRPANSSCRP